MNTRRHFASTAVIISGGGSPGAYDLVRSLGMANIRVSVASSQHDDIAFYSRHCHGRLLLPEFEPEHYETILKRLIAWVHPEGDKPVLYYISDPELTFVWKFREELKNYYRFLLPNDEVLESLFNKVLFNNLRERHHLPIPYAKTVHTMGELREVIDEVEFPCIVKPAFSHDWKWESEDLLDKFGPYKSALRRFENKDMLLAFCESLPERPAGYLVQSYIDGRDENIVSFHGYFDESSRCVAHFLGRKIRTYPPHTGGSAYVRTFHNDHLSKLGEEILTRIRAVGIVKIDFKWDDVRREYKVLEINTRYNLWQLLGAYAGVNLALIAYRHQRGESFPVPADFQDDARLLFFKQDLRSYWNGYRQTGEWSFVGYLASFIGKNYYRVFDPADPMPFVHSVFAFIQRRIGRAVGCVQTGPSRSREHASPAPVVSVSLSEGHNHRRHVRNLSI